MSENGKDPEPSERDGSYVKLLALEMLYTRSNVPSPTTTAAPPGLPHLSTY